MPTTTRKFVWYDVMTTNTKAAETFYRGVIGWDAKDSGMPDRPYTLLSVGSIMVGGLMPIPMHVKQASIRPGWVTSGLTMLMSMHAVLRSPAARSIAVPRIFRVLNVSP